MLIIWGTKPFIKEMGSSMRPYRCGNCGNVSNYRVFRRWTWFTLFWIPIIPLGKKYFITCPICNYGSKIKKNQALMEIGETATVIEQKPNGNEIQM